MRTHPWWITCESDSRTNKFSRIAGEVEIVEIGADDRRKRKGERYQAG